MIGNPLKWAIGGGGERDDPNDPSHNKKSFKNQQLSDKSDIRKAEQEDKKSDKKGVDGNKKSGKTWPRGILKSTGEGSSDEGQSIPLDKFRAAASEGGAKEVGKQPSSRSADLTTCTTMLPSAIKDEIGPMGAMINSQRRRTSAESGSLIDGRAVPDSAGEEDSDEFEYPSPKVSPKNSAENTPKKRASRPNMISSSWLPMDGPPPDTVTLGDSNLSNTRARIAQDRLNELRITSSGDANTAESVHTSSPVQNPSHSPSTPIPTVEIIDLDQPINSDDDFYYASPPGSPRQRQVLLSTEGSKVDCNGCALHCKGNAIQARDRPVTGIEAVKQMRGLLDNVYQLQQSLASIGVQKVHRGSELSSEPLLPASLSIEHPINSVTDQILQEMSARQLEHNIEVDIAYWAAGTRHLAIVYKIRMKEELAKMTTELGIPHQGEDERPGSHSFRERDGAGSAEEGSTKPVSTQTSGTGAEGGRKESFKNAGGKDAVHVLN